MTGGRSVPRRGRGESGQTATEFLMIAGLLTAMIVILDALVFRTLAYVVDQLVWRMLRFLSTV
jgi:hypothetical protein